MHTRTFGAQSRQLEAPGCSATPTPWKQLPEGHGGRAHAATAAASRALVALQLGGGETPCSTRDHQLEDTTCIFFFFCEQEVAALLEHKVLRFSPVTHPCSCRQSSNVSAALLSVLRNAVKGTARARTRGIGKKCHRFLFLNAFSFVQRVKNSPSAPSDVLARSSSAKGGRDKPFPQQKHAARGHSRGSLSSSTPRAVMPSLGLL